MAEGLYCYQCERGYPVAIHPPRCNDVGDRVCPQCASDFIELRQDEQPDAQLLRGLRTQLGLPQIEEPREAPGSRPSTQHHNFVTPGGTRVAVSLTTTTFMGDQLPADGSNMIIAALSNAFGGQSPMLLNLGNLLGGNETGLSMADFTSGEFGLEHILQRLMDQYQPQTTPASSTAVAELPRLKVSAAGAEAASDAAPAGTSAACRIGDACTVCHDDFQEGTEVMQLPCKHCFHQDCLLPWLETHNTCPVCRHALPVETNPRRTTSQRDPEELHHPAVEAALSGIGAGQAQRAHNDPRADPFWQFHRPRRTQDRQTPAAVHAAVPTSQQDFQNSVRQAMTNTVNLGNAAEAAQGIQELAHSLRLSNSGQWASQPGQVLAFMAGPDGRIHNLRQPTEPSSSVQATPGNMHESANNHQDDTASMPDLLTDDDESDSWDDDDEDADDSQPQGDVAQNEHLWQQQQQQVRQPSSQPQPIMPGSHQPQQDELQSHPAGSSIDDIDIELPLVQDEYASSEDALEGASAADEYMPSLLNDELASSGSDLVGAGEGGDIAARSQVHTAQSAAMADNLNGDADSEYQPDSSASSLTARSMLDPAQVFGAENLPNKRLKRDAGPESDCFEPAAHLQNAETPDNADLVSSSDRSASASQQGDRLSGGPFTWARRGAGALTSWALGMAGLR